MNFRYGILDLILQLLHFDPDSTERLLKLSQFADIIRIAGDGNGFLKIEKG